MEIHKAYAVYLSPTGTTEKTVTAITAGTGLPYERIDLTPLKARQGQARSFGGNEVVAVGLPVYAGRVPLNIDSFFSGLKGHGTPAIAVVVYGHRDYNDALLELKIRLEERGFAVKAGAAFIGEHTFSKNIAPGRPDRHDLAIAADFGKKVMAAIARDSTGPLTVKGDYPFTWKGYDPQKPEEHPLLPRLVTGEDCTRCGLCAENCPWGAIAINDGVATDHTKCMRCFRCIKICPVAARSFAGQEFLESLPEFEKRLNAVPKEPELFLGE